MLVTHGTYIIQLQSILALKNFPGLVILNLSHLKCYAVFK